MCVRCGQQEHHEVTWLKYACAQCCGMSVLWPPVYKITNAFSGNRSWEMVVHVVCIISLCYGKLCSYQSTLRACGHLSWLVAQRKSVSVSWWGVNYAGKRCLHGHPGPSCAGLALQCSRQRVCISTPMFHVSKEHVTYTCMNIVRGTYNRIWTVTAHCTLRVGRGKHLHSAWSWSTCQHKGGKIRVKIIKPRCWLSLQLIRECSTHRNNWAAHPHLTQTNLFLFFKIT